MRRFSASIGLAAALLAAGAVPAGAADLYRLLRQSTNADRRHSYQGLKLLTRWDQHGRSESTAKVFHAAPNETLMIVVDGDRRGARVLQLGRQHYVQAPGGSFRRTPLPPPIDNTDLLLRNYRLRQMRVEQVARRRCVMVSIEPRHPGNPRKIVWLDLKTGLALKTEVYNLRHEITEQSYFLRIQYNPRLQQSMFRLPANARRNEWPERSPNFSVIRVRDAGLPPGYERVETYVRETPDRHLVSFQRFSDGLNSLTLLQSRTLPVQRLRTLGGSATITGRVGRVNYVICGEQRPDLLRRIAENLLGSPLTIRLTSR